MDAGCGDGHIAIKAIEEYLPNGNVYAVDIYDASIEDMETYKKDNNVDNLINIEADITEGIPDVEDDSVDVILLVNVFHGFKASRRLDDAVIELKRIIKSELGVEPVGFRFPRWEYNKELFDVLLEEGFIYDSSVIKPNKSFKKELGYIYIRNGLYEFAPNIYKFPLKTVLLSGGGFYRFLKGKSLNRVLFKHIKKHDTFMIYFHPFEIHKGYLPVPKKGILKGQRVYLTKNRDTYLDSIEEMINTLKDNGYIFSNMKEYALKNKK